MNNRIWFAQMLRGIAALSVFICHCVLGFWSTPKVIPTIIQTPDVNFYSSKLHVITEILNKIHFNFGPFGVALFFLISGFVIPITLEKCNLKEFAIRRFFRIIPTYALGLAITCSILIFSAHYIGEKFNHNLWDYIINSTLIFQYIFRVKTIDHLNWTLIVEAYFYISIALVAKFILLKNQSKFIIYPTGLFIIALFLTFIKDKSFVWIIGYIIFMSIGTFIYLNYRKVLTKAKSAAYIGFTYAMFLSYILINPVHNKAFINAYCINYTLALVVFLACYKTRNKLKFNKFFNYIADISYPLYIIHGVGSYAIMSMLYQTIPNMLVCLAASLVFSFGTAIVLHHYVELPMTKLGKELSKMKSTEALSKGGGGFPPIWICIT